MKEAASPLVIEGIPGSGKSTLLANWKLSLNSRPLSFHHMQYDQVKEPFIFYHNVGCTRASTCIDQMLRRLIGTLKSSFNLGTPIPADPKRLPWCLSTFLELSAAVRPIFVVIDGIHRLHSSEGDYDNLQWLPLCFPANVRLIVSVTTTTTEINHHHGDKQKSSPWHDVIMELRNRKWPVMQLQSLDKDRRWAIIHRFLFKQKQPCAFVDTTTDGERGKDNSSSSPSDFVRGETSVAATNGTDYKDAVNYATPPSEEVAWLDSEGQRMHLFPIMVDSIIHAQATSSVRYLRVLLHSLEAGHIQGYNLQQMLNHLLQAKDMNSLYLAVLEHFAKGHFPPTTAHAATAAVAASEQPPDKHTEGETLNLCVAKDARKRTSLGDECVSSPLVVNKEEEQFSLDGVQQPEEEKKKECISIEANGDRTSHCNRYDANERGGGGGFEAAAAADEDKKEENRESFRKATIQVQNVLVCGGNDERTPISKAMVATDPNHCPTENSNEEAAKMSEAVVPLSLRGGSPQASDPLLMNMLKKALALVYSAQHGLQESELWDMLRTLAEREAAAAEKDVETQVVNLLAFRLMQSRRRLMDLLRDMDTDKNGSVDMHEFKHGLEGLGIHLTDQQMQNIVECIDTDGNGQLDFDEIIERYGSAIRRSFAAGRGGAAAVTPSFLTSQQNENERAAADEGHEDGGLPNRHILSEKLKKILICIMRGLGVSYHPNNSLFCLDLMLKISDLSFMSAT